jgi:hypothetical protein
MKWTLRSFVCCVFCLVLPVAGLLAEEEKVADTKQEATEHAGHAHGEMAHAMPSEAEMAEMMARWQAAATPGDGHRKLEPLVGKWKLTTRMWMGPGEPTVTEGTSEAKWILGGRYLHEEVNSEMMGQPLHGLGLTGYDNFNQRYQTFWIDNMGTAMTLAQGEVDAAGKVFTFQGTMDDPGTNERGKPLKMVVRIVNEDLHVFEMYDLTHGEGVKAFEIEYARVK